MVLRAGLEPTTLCLEGRCSIQLSYRSTFALSIAIRMNSARAVRKAFLTIRINDANCLRGLSNGPRELRELSAKLF